MAVESNVIRKKEKREYPYFGINEHGSIVFFTLNGMAVYVHGEEWKIGANEKAECFDESMFTPLSPSESITLRNV